MQLPLPVSLPVDETFDSFVSGTDTELVTLLQALAYAVPDWRDASLFQGVASLKLPMVTLLGSAGRGKSHLLYALCHEIAARDIPHVYLNLNNAEAWPANAFEGFETLPLVCLDNIHAIAGNKTLELALFDLINRVVESQQTVLVCTSRLGPSNPAFVLPDLRSRLSWGVTYQLHALSDEARKTVVRNRATARGLRLSEQALQFLLHHSERDIPSLINLLDRLDTRSLQEQKKLSVNMVKRELGLY
ncbi:DnaA regulatory inactivator Hda [Alteromonas sp. H39]|uniref:DnaA regulatory inactivator Hda n=1 Tax=Alteromonas sp. H39 TaxID=3389876 RepID=UPI0039E1D406